MVERKSEIPTHHDVTIMNEREYGNDGVNNDNGRGRYTQHHSKEPGNEEWDQGWLYKLTSCVTHLIYHQSALQ